MFKSLGRASRDKGSYDGVNGDGKSTKEVPGLRSEWEDGTTWLTGRRVKG